MSDAEDFSQLLLRVRNGDDSAAEALFTRYGGVLRRTLQLRLRNTALQRVVDAEDVCQSVFKSFFLRAGHGEYDLQSANDLVNLLMRIAHNKLTAQKRKQEADCRDIRRSAGDPTEMPVAQRGPSVSRCLAMKELFDKARARFTQEELRLFELRVQEGMEWAAIAAQTGGTAEGCRKQWERARERVMDELED